MMIKEQVKALWKVCFDDSEEFVEMYFRSLYASRFPKQRGHARAFITVFRPDVTEWSTLQHINTGRTLVV